ncbi:hypothetical protein KY334_04240, partial [Candidatus Woesearchaeota archaeon]|nr:hypothetical protein [Candidatus Woesearchaeota archaeon]
MGIKIGMELEFHLLDENGKVVNRAGDVLSHKYNGGNIIKELSKSMVEVIAPPSDNLDLVKNNFKKELLNLKQITNDLNLYVMPSSSIGNDVEIISNDSERERGMKKRLILGYYLRDLEHHICGTHIHVDRCKDEQKLFNQYLLMQAMDPLFSLMSSTPFFMG